MKVPPCLAGVDLFLGGLNVCEDLHFSTFYLRASLSAATLPDYPGYSFILAAYEKGVERYYVSASEAERTAKWLIAKCLSDSNWLRDILNAIEVNSKKLADAFPRCMTAESLRELSTLALVELYLRHNDLHRALYRVARIPEALDRGFPFFTEYLRDYLKEVGIAESDRVHAFQAFTAPRLPSVLADEEIAFTRIALDSLPFCGELSASHTPEMFLPFKIRESIRLHREQWGWLSYHGYRNRALPTEHEYCRRLCGMLRDRRIVGTIEKTEGALIGNENLAHQPAIVDARHWELFRLYPEIGRIKLLRRFWQLRNFYFLDQLLAEFARRLDVPEWEIRCCFPEELLRGIHEGHLGYWVKNRTQFCVVLYSAEGEYVWVGEEALALLDSITIRRESNDKTDSRLGTPACIGFARGIARQVGQSHFVTSAFQDGEVLVCEAADPDFLPMIRKASAVVTQQGGVTSHASVLCREIGVPTVIGVEDLLTFIRDGDEVEVDATAGVVKLIARDPEWRRKELIIPLELWELPECVGQKAANLLRAMKRGVQVPPFTVLSFGVTSKMLEDEEAALRLEISKLITELGSNAKSPDSFILRSSAEDEDSINGLRSGHYVSVILPPAGDPIGAVREFVERNRLLQYSGVIVLQRQLMAEVCGVSIDGDPRTGAGNRLIVEFARGPLNIVTDGKVSPERFVYDYGLGEVTCAGDGGGVQFALGDLSLGNLVGWFSSLREIFGIPTYTEWGFAGGELWLYQIRGTNF